MSYRASAFAEALPELAAPGCTPERLAHLDVHATMTPSGACHELPRGSPRPGLGGASDAQAS
jgi:hypothetical protein